MELYRQGDVLLVAVDAIPGARQNIAREEGRVVVARGEVTGHAHAIVDEAAELVSAEDARELYLLVHGTESVDLVHEDHDPLSVPPGFYRVIRQREYAPEAPLSMRDVVD